MKKYIIGAIVALVVITLIATPIVLSKRKKDKALASEKPSSQNSLSSQEKEEQPQDKETED